MFPNHSLRGTQKKRGLHSDSFYLLCEVFAYLRAQIKTSKSPRRGVSVLAKYFEHFRKLRSFTKLNTSLTLFQYVFFTHTVGRFRFTSFNITFFGTRAKIINLLQKMCPTKNFGRTHFDSDVEAQFR